MQQFKCADCNVLFKTKQNLQDHQNKKIKCTDKKYKCTQCNGTFVRKSSLRYHIENHCPGPQSDPVSQLNDAQKAIRDLEDEIDKLTKKLETKNDDISDDVDIIPSNSLDLKTVGKVVPSRSQVYKDNLEFDIIDTFMSTMQDNNYDVKVWKQIDDKYEMSSCGEVRNRLNQSMVTYLKDNPKTPTIDLYSRGKKKRMTVKYIMASLFLQPSPFVDFKIVTKNNNEFDLHPSNLEYVDSSIKFCTLCHTEETSENIFIKSRCYECNILKQKARRQTLKGFMMTLASTSKSTAKKRKLTDEVKGEHTIDADALIGLWNRQQGKCYYSGIAMTLRTSTAWLCSIERLKPDRGYVHSNVVLCCVEFNTCLQWSLAKIDKIPSLINQDVDLENLQKRLIRKRSARKKEEFSPERNMIDGVEHVKCLDCRLIRTCDYFYHKNENVCRKCKDARAQTDERIVLHRLRRIYNHARQRSTHWAKINKIVKAEWDLTLDFLSDLLLQQKGRCAYSNIPLKFGNGDWHISLERINSGKGYVQDNVCFICWEFNIMTPCESTSSNDIGWSASKFDLFMKTKFA